MSVQKLDTLLNLVGELVIHNSGFVATTQQLREQYGKNRFIYDLEEKTEALSAITRDLQDGIMKARMLPIANVFNRFRRVVRDLAKASKKQIILDVFGEETEIDKKVIDRIGEPLVHLVRNAVDHGLESEEQRRAAGKTPAGTIRLGAYQEGDHICIEVGDDGHGLDRNAILTKALEKGLITREEVATASPERIFGFIFLPGFSTARVVSDISGRGVGMDAVKRAVDEMSGSVRVRSTPGAGTTVTITLPLTMAIITAVLVEVAGSTYAVPLSAYVEPDTSTSTAVMMAIVSGRVMVTVVPAPGLERTRTLPLISSTARFTASMPTPRPGMSETVRAVLNPGRKMKPKIFRRSRRRLLAGNQALFQGLLQYGLSVQAVAVVPHLDADVVALLVGAQADRPAALLPAADAARRTPSRDRRRCARGAPAVRRSCR